MDFSKASDSINRDFLLENLRAFGFSASAQNLLYSYLKNRKQKVAINNKFSSSEVITAAALSSSEVAIAGVLPGSIDGPLLFNLFINDFVLFLYTTALSHYADNKNFYLIGNDKEEAKKVPVGDFQTVIDWFYKNYMILNTRKCNYICMGKDAGEKETFQILTQQKIINSKEVVKMLGIKVGRKLSFYHHNKNQESRFARKQAKN